MLAKNSMVFRWLFYTAKPVIPRRVQVLLRRRIAQYIRKKNGHLWPIDPNSARPPEGWKGWPDGKKFALVLCHDVDTLVGYNNVLKVAELEERMGFRSYFSFVPERYGKISLDLLDQLRRRGFDVAIHGLKHDGKLFLSKRIFDRQAPRINAYLKKWKSAGFTSPSMHRNLDWMTALNIDYSTSTFDTDPFEPQPDGVGTIFPFVVHKNGSNQSAVSNQRSAVNSQITEKEDRIQKTVGSKENPAFLQESRTKHQAPGFQHPESCTHNPTDSTDSMDSMGAMNSMDSSNPSNSKDCFIELPYTLPQDSTLFIILQEKTIDIWKRKLDWVAEKGGMALLNTHPDYMDFEGDTRGELSYPVQHYIDFLEYLKRRYSGQYFSGLPADVADFCRRNCLESNSPAWPAASVKYQKPNT